MFPAAMIGLAAMLAGDGPARLAAGLAGTVVVGLGLVLPTGLAVVVAALIGPAAVILGQRVAQ